MIKQNDIVCHVRESFSARHGAEHRAGVRHAAGHVAPWTPLR
jgi:hypothetical protein